MKKKRTVGSVFFLIRPAGIQENYKQRNIRSPEAAGLSALAFFLAVLVPQWESRASPEQHVDTHCSMTSADHKNIQVRLSWIVSLLLKKYGVAVEVNYKNTS